MSQISIFNTTLRGNVLSGSLLLCLVLLLLRTSAVKGGVCDDNKPCLGRGGCYFIEETLHPTFLSTKCVCVRGYSGRWCQFKDDDRYDENTVILKDGPGVAKILTDVSAISYNRSYLLTWEKPSKSSPSLIFYYAVRYKKIDSKKWNVIDEILADDQTAVYSHEFKSLDWHATYEVEIYAGCAQGLGVPAKTIIQRPRISYPEIIQVSEDRTDSNVILEHTPLHLFCKAHGEPSPILSWYMNGKPLAHSNSSNVSIKNGSLTIFNTTIKEHQGIYRCFASNVWGTVMSRLIQVRITAPVEFINAMNKQNAKPEVEYLDIGVGDVLFCPRHTMTYPVPTYTWGNHGNDSSGDFRIEISDRVWVSPDGKLVFRVFTLEDMELINSKGGIRCIITQATTSGVRTIMSNAFVIKIYARYPWPKRQTNLRFSERTEEDLTLFRGESLSLYCTALSETRGKLVIQWSFESTDVDGGGGKRFERGVNVSDFGRVLKYDNVQKNDSGRIFCTAFNHDNNGTEEVETVRTSIFLKVIDKLEDFDRTMPREISVYNGSTLELDLYTMYVSHCNWYFNGRFLNTHTVRSDRVDLHNIRTNNSGIYQFDVVFSHRSFTAAFYVRVLEVEEPFETPPGREVKMDCVPPHSVYRSFLTHEYWNDGPRGRVSLHSFLKNNSLTLPSNLRGGVYPLACSASDRRTYFSTISREFTLVVKRKAVNGGWSSWSSWSSCPKLTHKCGQKTFRFRRRLCSRPAPSLDGEYCSGAGKEQDTCPFLPCPKPVPSVWSVWTSWAHCSKSCGAGLTIRRRICLRPVFWGGSCRGHNTEIKRCVAAPCSDISSGGWSKWSPWTKCSKTCGIGKRIRHRKCLGPAHDVENCRGHKTEIFHCLKTMCGKRIFPASKTTENKIIALPVIVFCVATLALAVISIGLFTRTCPCVINKETDHKLQHRSFDIEREPLLQKGKSRPTQKKRPPSRNLRKQQAAEGEVVPSPPPPPPAAAASVKSAARPDSRRTSIKQKSSLRTVDFPKPRAMSISRKSVSISDPGSPGIGSSRAGGAQPPSPPPPPPPPPSFK